MTAERSARFDLLKRILITNDVSTERYSGATKLRLLIVPFEFSSATNEYFAAIQVYSCQYFLRLPFGLVLRRQMIRVANRNEETNT